MNQRKPFVAGNWKMNKTAAAARELVAVMLAPLREFSGVEKVLCPPFLSIPSVASAVAGTDVGVGAQNMHWEEKGAFTGEVAPNMVKEFCKYVILGHSERRALFGETDEQVNRKIRAAMKVDLTPIVCVGETLDQYEAGLTAEVVTRQMKAGLANIDPAFVTRIVIAYEPVWAIGTGKASSGENANGVVKQVIRPALSGLFGDTIAEAVRVLYGGSVTAANAAEFFSQAEIDGALVGGASLKADEFVAIVKSSQK